MSGGGRFAACRSQRRPAKAPLRCGRGSWSLTGQAEAAEACPTSRQAANRIHHGAFRLGGQSGGGRNIAASVLRYLAAKKVRKWRRSEAAAPAIPRTGSSSLIAKVRVVDSPPDPLLPCAPLAAARGGAHCAPQARATSSPLRLRSRGARPAPQVQAVD